MKNKKLIVVLIILLSIISIALIALMIGMMNGSFKFNGFRFGNSVSDKLILDEVYDNQFENVEIITDASDIDIKKTDSLDVRVVVYDNKDNTIVDVNDKKLFIKSEADKCIGFCFNTKISKVEVYLPKDYDKSIKIINNYGNIEIDEFNAATINIEEDCGNVSVLGGNVVTISNDYGDVSIGKVNKANIEQSAGNVIIEDVHDAIVENSYGDIRITNIYNYLDLNADCGDISIDNLILNENSSIKNNLGDVRIGSTNEIRFDADTDLGSVNINNNNEKSDITLKIENDCGDIKVKN